MEVDNILLTENNGEDFGLEEDEVKSIEGS